MKIVGKCSLALLIMLSTAVVTGESNADDTIAPSEYLDRVFAGDVPKSAMIWMSGETKNAAKEILGHDPGYLRLRYWRTDAKTVWIIDEIGKTEPITFGMAIANNKIESAEVLAFRESRGWEIKHGFFRDQFSGASLDANLNLNRSIDGISGATLSVKAMTRVSRLVLYLTQALSS